MKSIRENPDGPENQAMERQHDRDVFAAKMAHLKAWECEACAGDGVLRTDTDEIICQHCDGTGRKPDTAQPRPTLREYLTREIRVCDLIATQDTAQGFKFHAEWHRGQACAYRDILRRLEAGLFEP